MSAIGVFNRDFVHLCHVMYAICFVKSSLLATDPSLQRDSIVISRVCGIFVGFSEVADVSVRATNHRNPQRQYKPSQRTNSTWFMHQSHGKLKYFLYALSREAYWTFEGSCIQQVTQDRHQHYIWKYFFDDFLLAHFWQKLWE